MMHRLRIPELMDAPDLAPPEHLEALRGLERINQASSSVRCTLKPIVDLAKARGLSHLHLLDVACGGGEVPIGVAAAARRAGIAIDLTLVDQSHTALAAVQQRAVDAKIVARTQSSSAFEQELPLADVVTCSLFLHHLDRPDVVRLLGRLAGATRYLLVVTDLRRSRLGWVIAWIGCRVLSRSPIVHFDGPVSVRAAWTPAELVAMAREAGLSSARVIRLWPWRMQLIWKKEDAA